MYNLTISNINIQGLNQSKLDAISFSEAYETDVICLTETHLQEQTDERFASANFFTLHVSQPTRITKTSSSCLDQILSNIPDKISNIDISAPVSTNDQCTVKIK